MAAGKSTIGRKLARELGCAFFDTDALVTRAHGTIPAIFAREGEAAFRRYEQDAIKRVLESGEPGVVALGGGALTVAANRRLLAREAYRIFLHISPEKILARVARGRGRRPLLGPAPTLERIRTLYESRLADYACADHVVEAERLSDRAVLDDILAWLHEAKIELPH